MTTIASGIEIILGLKKETTAGVLAGASGAQLLRDVSCTLDLTKDTYQSNEKVSTGQIQDFRHGVRRVTGSLNGELSPGTYKLPIAALLRKDFVAGVSTGTLTNITAAAGPPGTFTRGSGSFITDGFKVNDVVRWTGFTATANNTHNYRITALTATVMTVGTTLSGGVGGLEIVAAEASGSSVVCTVTGKKSYIPVSGRTSDSFTIEKYFADIAQSEQFVGCRFGSAKFSLPATGMATVTFGIIGIDLGGTGTSQYFTSPTAITTTGVTAAVNGFVRVGGSDIAIVTGCEINVDWGLGGDPVVGSNTIPALFYGIARVTGQLTAFFIDTTLRDLFVNETEAAINVMLTTNNTVTADFVSFVMSRVKLGGAPKSDSDKAIIQTLPFTALRDTAGASTTNTENTTLAIQDSAA